MTMTKMVKVIYWLSKEGQKKSLLMGGDGKHEQVFETPATERLIQLANVSREGELELEVKITKPVYVYEKSFPESTGIEEIDKRCVLDTITGVRDPYYSWTNEWYFDEPQTIESILKRYDEHEKLLEEMENAIPQENAKLKADYFKRLEEAKARYEEEEAKKKAREEEKRAREQEKADWIRKYGSQYLKDCLELGVKANLEYVVERAEHEFPGYTVDYADNAEWDEKFSPSQEALDELKLLREKGVESDIIWLTSPAIVRNEDNEEDECEYYYEEEKYEPREAVVIKNFLGMYTLVKEM